MRQEDRFYVYAHYDMTGELRYIGKGCGQRAFFRNGRSAAWLLCFPKDSPPRVDYIAQGLTENAACQREIEEISAARSRGCRLLNISDGGDSSQWTDDARARLSEMRQGEGSHWFGKTRPADLITKLNAGKDRYIAEHGHPRCGATVSTENRAKMAAASHTPAAIEKRNQKIRGRKLTAQHKSKLGLKGEAHPRFGKKASPEFRKKLSDSHKGIKYGPMSDEHKAKIAASRRASDAVKASSTQIWATRRANGTDQGYTTSKARPVRCLETGQVYRTAKDAAEAISANPKHIQACCTGRRKSHPRGIHWEYV